MSRNRWKVFVRMVFFHQLWEREREKRVDEDEWKLTWYWLRNKWIGIFTIFSSFSSHFSLSLSLRSSKMFHFNHKKAQLHFPFKKSCHSHKHKLFSSHVFDETKKTVSYIFSTVVKILLNFLSCPHTFNTHHSSHSSSFSSSISFFFSSSHSFTFSSSFSHFSSLIHNFSNSYSTLLIISLIIPSWTERLKYQKIEVPKDWSDNNYEPNCIHLHHTVTS